jgi:Calx-beta domain-containing protein
MLTFAPGETSKTVGVTVNGDTTVEPDESFTLNLTNASGAALSRSTGTATIVNDDASSPVRKKPTVQFSLSPARDRKAPFRYTAKGGIVLPSGIAVADGCFGNVQVSYQSGGKTIASDLAGVDGNCRFRLTTVFDNARKIKKGKLVVTARFRGNRLLLPASAPSRKARAG